MNGTKRLLYLAAEDAVVSAELGADGSLTVIDRSPAASPMYFAYDGGRLFSLLCRPDPASEDSAVVPVWVDGQGLPTDPTPALSTMGRVGCHLCVVDNVVYAANYDSGSVCRVPLDGGAPTLVRHNDAEHGPNPARQERAHPHYIAPTPDGKYLAVCDLGLDAVFVYDPDLNPVSRVQLPAGCGPRHLAYSTDGTVAYCADELSSEVSVLSYHDGRFAYLGSVLARREDADLSRRNTAAAIRCTDTHLYLSNRGDDDIAVFRLGGAGEMPQRIANLPCGGSFPRDFALYGDRMVITNEHSDNVVVLRLNEARTEAVLVGELTGIRAPIAVLAWDA